MAVSEARRRRHLSSAQTEPSAHRASPTNAKRSGLDKLADSDLLVLVSRRETRAFEVIYDRHIEVTWRVALMYSDDVPSAERAVEAAFLGLWRQPEPGSRASLAVRLTSTVKREARAGQA